MLCGTDAPLSQQNLPCSSFLSVRAEGRNRLRPLAVENLLQRFVLDPGCEPKLGANRCLALSKALHPGERAARLRMAHWPTKAFIAKSKPARPFISSFGL